MCRNVPYCAVHCKYWSEELGTHQSRAADPQTTFNQLKTNSVIFYTASFLNNSPQENFNEILTHLENVKSSKFTFYYFKISLNVEDKYMPSSSIICVALRNFVIFWNWAWICNPPKLDTWRNVQIFKYICANVCMS